MRTHGHGQRHPGDLRRRHGWSGGIGRVRRARMVPLHHERGHPGVDLDRSRWCGTRPAGRDGSPPRCRRRPPRRRTSPPSSPTRSRNPATSCSPTPRAPGGRGPRRRPGARRHGPSPPAGPIRAGGSRSPRRQPPHQPSPGIDAGAHAVLPQEGAVEAPHIGGAGDEPHRSSRGPRPRGGTTPATGRHDGTGGSGTAGPRKERKPPAICPACRSAARPASDPVPVRTTVATAAVPGSEMGGHASPSRPAPAGGCRRFPPLGPIVVSSGAVRAGSRIPLAWLVGDESTT